MGDRDFDSGAAQAFPLKQITKAESSSERRNRQYWNPTSQFDPYGPTTNYPDPLEVQAEEQPDCRRFASRTESISARKKR